MLPQVNYRVPNMRFLRDKLVVRPPWAPPLCVEKVFKPPQLGWSRPWYHWLRSGGPALMHHPLWQEVEARNEMTFSHFIQFYKNLMFDAQKSVRAMACPPKHLPPGVACARPAKPGPLLCLAGHRTAGALLPLAVSTWEPSGSHPGQASKGRIHRVGNAARLQGRAWGEQRVWAVHVATKRLPASGQAWAGGDGGDGKGGLRGRDGRGSGSRDGRRDEREWERGWEWGWEQR